MNIPRKLSDINQTIDRWVYREKLPLVKLTRFSTPRRSVWQSGNCIILLEQLTESETELHCVAVKLREPDITARNIWKRIGELLQSVGWIPATEPLADTGFLGWLREAMLTDLTKINLAEFSKHKRQSIEENWMFYNASVVTSPEERQKFVESRLNEETEKIKIEIEAAREKLDLLAHVDKLTVEQAAAEYFDSLRTAGLATRSSEVSDATEKQTVVRLPHPDDRKRAEHIRQLHHDGRSISEMASAVGVSESTIKRELKKLGLTIKRH